MAKPSQIIQQVEDILAQIKALVDRSSGLLSGDAATISPPGPVAPVVTPLPALPAPTLLPPAPVVTSPVTSVAIPAGAFVTTGIVTSWRDKEDEGTDPAETASGLIMQPGDGLRVQVVSLPAPVRKGRIAYFQHARPDSTPLGPWVGPFRQAETGPWRLGDTYWSTRATPWAQKHKGEHVRWMPKVGWDPEGTGAKTLTCNGAIGDLPPIVSALVIAYENPGQTVAQLAQHFYLYPSQLVVNTIVIDEPVTTELHPQDDSLALFTADQVVKRLQDAATQPMWYLIGTGGHAPARSHPGEWHPDTQRWTADCSAIGCWGFGLERDVSGMNTDGSIDDAQAHHKYFDEVSGRSIPGADLLVVGKRPGHEYGHEGIVMAVDAQGLPSGVAHCSSMNPEGRALAITNTKWFVDAGARLLRYRHLLPAA